MSAPPPSYECAIGLVDDDRDIPEIVTSTSSSSSVHSLLLERPKSTQRGSTTTANHSTIQPRCHCKLKCIHIFLLFLLVLFLLFKLMPDVYKPLCTRLIGLLDSNSTAEFDELSFRGNFTTFCDNL
jgi:hypothetical protein